MLTYEQVLALGVMMLADHHAERFARTPTPNYARRDQQVKIALALGVDQAQIDECLSYDRQLVDQALTAGVDVPTFILEHKAKLKGWEAAPAPAEKTHDFADANKQTVQELTGLDAAIPGGSSKSKRSSDG